MNTVYLENIKCRYTGSCNWTHACRVTRKLNYNCAVHTRKECRTQSVV